MKELYIRPHVQLRLLAQTQAHARMHTHVHKQAKCVENKVSDLDELQCNIKL
jgi:hypothetical protein